MTIKELIYALFVLSVFCATGYSDVPASVEEPRAIRLLFEAAMAEPTRAIALNALELLAANRATAIPRDDLNRLGVELLPTLPPGTGSYQYLAILKLRDTLLPEAIEFLGNLDPGPGEKGNLPKIAAIAYHTARLETITDPQERTVFLEDAIRVVTEHSGNQLAAGDVAWWAEEILCDTGTVQSLGVVGEYYRFTKEPDWADKLQFCEARMRLVHSSPNHVAALANGLVTGALGPQSERLMSWAFYELERLQTTESIAALDRFSDVVAAMPPESVNDIARRIAATNIRDRAMRRSPARPK